MNNIAKPYWYVILGRSMLTLLQMVNLLISWSSE